MSEVAEVAVGSASLLAGAHALVDQLLEYPVDLDSADALLDSVRSLHQLTNRLAAVEHRLVREVDGRSFAWDRGARDTAALLRSMLLLDPHDARARVRAAEAAGPRQTLSGEPLPPIYPRVAAAQAAGDISQRQAVVIVSTIEKLPDGVQAEHGELVETELVGFAASLDPFLLAKAGLRIRQLLDPDGVLDDHERRWRERDVNTHVRADGSGTMHADLTPECMQRLLVAFDVLAAPKPAADGVKDPRTAGQRRHDALDDVLDIAQRAQTMTTTGGVAATVVLTADVDDWTGNTGFATTGHGAPVPVCEAKKWFGADLRVIAALFDRITAVRGYSHTQRIFTEQQRLVIHARDGGCIFPGCDAPAAWCQIHHVATHESGGPTSIDNGVLICRYHHRHFERMGWQVLMCDGVPEWIPPRWVDPAQRPRRNHLHDAVPDFRRVVLRRCTTLPTASP